MDPNDQYTPHSYSQPLQLPPVPTSISLSPPGDSSLQSWIRGLSSTPVPYHDPQALDVLTSRWESKWNYFRQTFRPETDQADIISANSQTLVQIVNRLESELSRMTARFTDIDTSKATSEVTCGVQYILSLIEQKTPTMYKLNVEAPIPDKLQSARQNVQDVDIVYKFALQSFAHITMLNARQVLGSRINPGPSAIDDPESGMSDIHEEGHSDGIRTPSPSIHEMPLPEVYEPQTYGLTQGGGSSAPTSTIAPAPQEKIPPSILNNQSYNPRQRGRINFEPPRIIQPPSQALSSSTSHRVNLLTLSGVSFFGAGMAWSTVFSGTRGDLVLISWAACCFIISAVISAAVTSLLDTDGNLLERFLVVRWAVRLLGIFSAIHAFVGVSLVSAAILVLDPNSSEAEAGFHGEAGGFSVVAGRAAGAYSLIVCSVGVLLVVLVRRRYSRKTWFT